MAFALVYCSALDAPPSVAQQTSTTETSGWNLRWRKSPKVAPQQLQVPSRDVFAEPAKRSTTATAARQTRAADGARTVADPGRATHAQVDYPQPLTDRSAGEPDNRLRSARQTAVRQTAHDEPVTSNYKRTAEPPNDFFKNPFAQGRRKANQPLQVQTVAAPTGRIALQPPQNSQVRPSPQPRVALLPAPQETGGLPFPQSTQTLPETANGDTGNALRDPASGASEKMELPPSTATPTPAENLPQPQTLPPTQTLPGSDAGGSLRGLLNDPNELIQPGAPATDDVPDNGSPSDQGESTGKRFDGSPFDQERANRGAVDRLQPGSQTDDQQSMAPRGTEMIKPNQLSCEDFRERIARETIYRVSLDPSPPFRPDLFDEKDYQRQFAKFENRQTVRPWRDVNGQVIANGKMIKLAYEQIVIETDDGSTEELPIDRLGEGDLAYVSENWGLPKKCLIEQVAYTPRSWTPLTMTWKASNLCSKPRYFEEVNLERYGHTTGPWLQPVVSSAHFFVNVAVVPYKMGIHPPTECHYALGYYRPGNCAPWIVPPVPISARGALSQAAVMTGAFWLIP